MTKNIDVTGSSLIVFFREVDKRYRDRSGERMDLLEDRS